MTTTNKGFSNSIVIAIIAILIVVAAVAFYSNKKSTDTNTESAASSTVETATATNTVNTPSNTATSPSISWTYVKKDATANTVILNLNGKTYNTGVSGLGCGTEVAKANLAPGQLSATQCTIKGESGTEVAVYREGKGYKVTSTEIHNISDGQNITHERGTSNTILNIK